MSHIEFSIVISTLNRAAMLKTTLNSLRLQHNHVPHEVIVVDNNSSDHTRELVHTMQPTYPYPLRYVFEPQPGIAAARNAGASASAAPYIAFLDDDVLVQAGWLDTLASTHRDYPDAWCIGGRVTLNLPDPVPSWLNSASPRLRAYLSEFDRGANTERLNYPDGILGANFSVTRVALNSLGAFDRHLGHSGLHLLGGEETDLCWRIQAAGKGVYYCGMASVAHVVPETRLKKRFFRSRAYWEGRTKALLWASPSWRSLLRGCANAAFSYSLGRFDMGFEHELALWKLAGYLQQKALAPRSNGRRRYLDNQKQDEASVCAESAGS